MDARKFVQGVTWRAAQLKSTATDGRGGWRLGVTLWVNPEVRCPWCNEGVATQRVWATDDRKRQVVKVWELDGREVCDSSQWHPHVFVDSRRVCMGDAEDLGQALWMGLQPGDRANTSMDIAGWLERLGHKCDRRRLSYVVDAEVEEEADDHAGESYCDRCDEWHSVYHVNYCETTNLDYCNDCWVETHDRCADCNRWMLTDSASRRREYMMTTHDGREVCERCYENDYFACDNCTEVYHFDDCVEGPSESDNWCRECRADARKDCEGCGEECWEQDLDSDGLCDTCARCDEVCGECDKPAAELLDNKCRECYYGDTGLVGESNLEEVTDGE